MASIFPGYEYDIFISYRQKDNKGDRWVSEFVNALKNELESTFKEEISVYFDINPHEGLLETHNVEASLKEKLKCLIFIPVISQTYCDPKSFAWQYEFCAFNKSAIGDQFGKDIRLPGGNVASRILPVKIHDLDAEDKTLLENELGGVLRAVDFIYKEAGVNRPLKPTDNKNENQNKTDYRNQVNKVANAVKEIIGSLRRPYSNNSRPDKLQAPERKSMKGDFEKTGNQLKILLILFSLTIFTAAALLLNKYYFPEKSSIYLIAILSVIIIAVVVLMLKKYYFSEKGLHAEHKKIVTANPVAYEWFMKAEFRLTPENNCDVDSCIFFLKKAIEADSSFALAHAELSRAYSIKNYFIDPNGGYTEKAFIEAEKSLYMNPNLAEGYFAKAYLTWNFHNKFPHEKVIREYKRAIALKPDLDEAYHQLGVVYFHVGLIDEGFEAYRKALKINPDNKFTAVDLASMYFFTGKKTDLELLIDLFKEQPDNLISSFRATQWAIALITLDRLCEAEIILSEFLTKDPSDLFINSALAILQTKKGDRTGALKKIELCEKSNLNTGHFHHAVYNLAVAYALLGDFKRSVRKLTWVAENGFPNYTIFRDDQLLDSLHQFTPYNELLKKLKKSWTKYRQVANE
jgi:tetratricopeptide (TPR) repeat protein